MAHSSPDSQYRKFHRAVTIFLGGMAGLLISLPLMGEGGLLAAGLPALFAGLGALSGYRNRDNHVFFYICLITICVMFVLLLRQ